MNIESIANSSSSTASRASIHHIYKTRLSSNRVMISLPSPIFLARIVPDRLWPSDTRFHIYQHFSLAGSPDRAPRPNESSSIEKREGEKPTFDPFLSLLRPPLLTESAVSVSVITSTENVNWRSAWRDGRFYRSRTRSQLATLTSYGTSSHGKFASEERFYSNFGSNPCISLFYIGRTNIDVLIAWGKEEGSALKVHGEKRENVAFVFVPR